MRGGPARLLGALRAALTENLAYKVISLGTALLLWTWVQSEQLVQERVRVRLDWRLPEGYALVEQPLAYATVTVEGVQAVARGMRQKELSLPVDLTGAREGDVNLDLTDRPVEGLPDQVQVVSVAPSSLQVRLDRLLRRKLPVVPVTRGDVAEGYALKKVTVSPDRVEVSGPASVVRALTEVATDEVDVTALKEDADFQVGLNLKKGLIRAARSGDFTVAVRVAAVTRERTFDAVPVTLQDDGTYALVTETVAVTLAGPGDRLDGIAADDVRVIVHVPPDAAMTEGEARLGAGAGLRYEVVQPGGESVDVRSVDPPTIGVKKR